MRERRDRRSIMTTAINSAACDCQRVLRDAPERPRGVPKCPGMPRSIANVRIEPTAARSYGETFATKCNKRQQFSRPRPRWAGMSHYLALRGSRVVLDPDRPGDGPALLALPGDACESGIAIGWGSDRCAGTVLRQQRVELADLCVD